MGLERAISVRAEETPGSLPMPRASYDQRSWLYIWKGDLATGNHRTAVLRTIAKALICKKAAKAEWIRRLPVGFIEKAGVWGINTVRQRRQCPEPPSNDRSAWAHCLSEEYWNLRIREAIRDHLFQPRHCRFGETEAPKVMIDSRLRE